MLAGCDPLNPGQCGVHLMLLRPSLPLHLSMGNRTHALRCLEPRQLLPENCAVQLFADQVRVWDTLEAEKDEAMEMRKTDGDKGKDFRHQ